MLTDTKSFFSGWLLREEAIRTNLFGIYCADEDIIHCLFYDESIGGTGLNEVACVAAVSFPFPNAREREENCERMANFFAHPRRAPSLARFSFACSIFAPPEKWHPIFTKRN